MQSHSFDWYTTPFIETHLSLNIFQYVDVMKKSTFQVVVLSVVAVGLYPITRHIVEKHSGFMDAFLFFAMLVLAYLLHILIYKPVEKRFCEKGNPKQAEKSQDDS